MNPHRNCAVTLVELLIALTLATIIVLGLNSIDLFSNAHVVTASRRAKIQNEVTMALEHMTKNIMQTSGNEIISGADNIIAISAGSQIGFAATAYGAYRLSGNQLQYCSSCTTINCGACTPGWSTVAYNINSFAPCKPVSNNNCWTGTGTPLAKNYVTINIQACWDPSRTDCGTAPNNPTVNMIADIKLPSVSVN
jgi:hypothetical protein